MKNLDLSKLKEFMGCALKNGLRLHFDSIHLFKNNSWPSSFHLSVISMEEIGKAFWVDRFVFHTEVDGQMKAEAEKEWYNILASDHTEKQKAFHREFFYDYSKKYLKQVGYKQLEYKKQNSVYVGFQKTKSKTPTEGKILNPFDTTREEAKKQIDIVNQFFVKSINFKLRGTIVYDYDQIDRLMTLELKQKLDHLWK